MAQSQIDAARAEPTAVELALQDEEHRGTADPFEIAMQEADSCIKLAGDEQRAYAEFCSAAAALESHQKQSAALMERYKAALQRLSEQAAKAGR